MSAQEHSKGEVYRVQTTGDDEFVASVLTKEGRYVQFTDKELKDPIDGYKGKIKPGAKIEYDKGPDGSIGDISPTRF
jgi:hypothetical protein